VPHTLLLADDSVTIQRVIELTFADEDVNVVAVSDGDQAIQRIESAPPDIVLADIGMPKRSGYEVSAFVKNKPELSHIPVLLLAGAFEPVDDAKAKEAGCDGVLVKPFEPQQVIARVRELISGAKGSPTRPAVSDVPRPAAALTTPRPVELATREDKPAVEDMMDIGDDLLPSVDDLLPQDDFLARSDDLFPKVEDFEAASPLESAPPPILLDDTLDDYFDKLDEAFATIGSSATPAPSSAEPEPARPDGPVLESELEAFDMEPVVETPSAVDVPTLDDLLADMPASPRLTDISFDSLDDPTAVEPPRVIDFPSPPPTPLTPFSVAIAPPPIEAPAAPEAEASSGRSIIADAFSAILAQEQGEPGAVIPRLGGNGSQPVVTEALIDDVSKRVIERLALGSSDRLQAIVKEIVSGVAERLVREEIDRIRSGERAAGSGQ